MVEYWKDLNIIGPYQMTKNVSNELNGAKKSKKYSKNKHVTIESRSIVVLDVHSNTAQTNGRQIQPIKLAYIIDSSWRMAKMVRETSNTNQIHTREKKVALCDNCRTDINFEIYHKHSISIFFLCNRRSANRLCVVYVFFFRILFWAIKIMLKSRIKPWVKLYSSLRAVLSNDTVANGDIYLLHSH